MTSEHRVWKPGSDEPVNEDWMDSGFESIREELGGENPEEFVSRTEAGVEDVSVSVSLPEDVYGGLLVLAEMTDRSPEMMARHIVRACIKAMSTPTRSKSQRSKKSGITDFDFSGIEAQDV